MTYGPVAPAHAGVTSQYPLACQLITSVLVSRSRPKASSYSYLGQILDEGLLLVFLLCIVETTNATYIVVIGKDSGS